MTQTTRREAASRAVHPVEAALRPERDGSRLAGAWAGERASLPICAGQAGVRRGLDSITGADLETQITRLPALRACELQQFALPQAGFGDTDFYPDVYDEAAVLACRIAWDHP